MSQLYVVDAASSIRRPLFTIDFATWNGIPQSEKSWRAAETRWYASKLSAQWADFGVQFIAGEEPELCLRMREKGWKIWRVDAEMTRHDAAITRFGQWWMRCVRSGYGMAQISRLHKKSPFVIWKRETRSAIFWGGLVPFAIGLAMLANPIAMVGALIYPLQICRLAFYRGLNGRHSWAYALFMVLAQFPELQGILKFNWHCATGVAGELIEYKEQ